MLTKAQLQTLFLACALLSHSAWAGPYVEAGDMAFRQDIQRLADHGVIRGPVTMWPLPWGAVLEDLNRADMTSLPPAVADALARVKRRADESTQTGRLAFNAKVGGAEKPTAIRSFQNTPRGEAEVSVGVSWLGDWFSMDLNGQYVSSDTGDKEFRYDNTMLGVVVGNWSIAASTQERWWGPGWDGSIILSNNARPIPSLVIDRVYTDPFKSKWLSWLGPWDFNVIFGEMESDRAVPNAKFFGARLNFRPIETLEIGVSRSAQWCGNGRPCDLDTFVDLLLGQDNRGDDGITSDDEPGNQLAGFDIRWTPGVFGRNVALYTQWIGEDEAGGFPSRYLGQVGAEWSGYFANRWSTHAFAEYSGTTCQFHERSKIYNCAYNHGIYTTGYRYRGRSIGHGADSDAEVMSVGLALVDAENTQWRAIARFGELNRDGASDPNHTLTPTPQDIASVDLSHSRRFWFGTVDLGAGYEEIDDSVSGATVDDVRFFAQWRSAY